MKIQHKIAPKSELRHQTKQTINVTNRHTSEEDVFLAQSLVDRTCGLGPGGSADTAGVAEHRIDVFTPMRRDGTHDHAQHVDEAQNHLLVQRSVRADRPISAKRKRKVKEKREKKNKDQKRLKRKENYLHQWNNKKCSITAERTVLTRISNRQSHIARLVQPQKSNTNEKHTQQHAPGSTFTHPTCRNHGR